jgi:putative oxygen-independent coproporphyrinogen III oxidase
MPWCIQKCPYCDFNSYATRGEKIPEQEYIELLLKDLNHDLQYVYNRKLCSIFIGGGTPSLFSANSIGYLLESINAKIAFEDDIEITLEANPGTLEAQKFKDFYQAGVNRISIGVQSFNDDFLKILGRIHGSQEAKRAIDAVIQAGFQRFNVDLMYALPNQTAAQACADLSQALQLGSPHISWYHLTLEPQTPFYRNPPKGLPEDEKVIEIENQGRALLAAHGLQRYEISAYGKPGQPSKHNRNYWEFGDYLGIGAGAHAKLTLAEGVIKRFTKHKTPFKYMQANSQFISNEIILSSDDLRVEFMMNALRLIDGIPLNHFCERTGLTLSSIQSQLSQAQQKNWITIDNNVLHPTKQGQQFLNDVVALFI